MYQSRSIYPSFDVLAEQNAWDECTRQIVTNRVGQFTFSTITEQEIQTLFELCTVLLSDNREEILRHVVSHFDKKVSSSVGEGQRKQGLPEQKVMIRGGIQALDAYCQSNHGSTFAALDESSMSQVVDALFKGQVQFMIGGTSVSAQDFMSAILSEAVSSYYSHPTVWSEIGYAGPAYPRGYVRTERGLTDPWEARQQNA